MSFAHAIETTRKDKTQIQEKNGEFVVVVNEEEIVIRGFCFYKPDFEGVLDSTGPTIRVPPTEIKTCPVIKIPIPVVRRKAVFDNKFFFAELSKIGRPPAQIHGPVLPGRNGILYIPFLYCYFEETFHEESAGYIIRTFPKYSSKIDRNLTFVDWNNFTEREDEELKSKAIEMWIEIQSLRQRASALEEEFDKIDQYGKLQKEFRDMEKKLIQR